MRLMPYKDLFTYEQTNLEKCRLDDDFDTKMLQAIGETAQVKAVTISLTQRLKPLFKAAAIVAIILTLGNAMQVAMKPSEPAPVADNSAYSTQEAPVAKVDTLHKDSMIINEAPILK